MKKIAAWFLLLFLALPVIAQEGNLPASVRQACGPYLQNVTDTSFTVIWTTNMDAVSWVEVAPDDGTNWNNTARPKYYDLRGFGRRPIAKVHHVTVKGLEPDTKYRYRIMMEGGPASTTGWVSPTAPAMVWMSSATPHPSAQRPVLTTACTLRW